MKISPLLLEFLSNNKQLDLAGIGRFTLDDGATIGFEQNASVREDVNLVNFIAEKTGKMKSLVASDLDSHLELARQFINIGKPYLFEGIGTLTKNKFGKFEFVQSNSAGDKKENVIEGRDMTSTTENSFTDYEEMFSPRKPKGSAAKKMVTWLIAIAGLSLAVFGGYLVYSKTKNKKEVVQAKNENTGISKPSAEDLKAKDSLEQSIRKIIAPSQPVDTSGTLYKFVIENANRSRAFYRYNKLRSDSIKVQMDTKDSVRFRLFFPLHSMPADTARKRDSLQRLYGTRSRTIVELN